MNFNENESDSRYDAIICGDAPAPRYDFHNAPDFGDPILEGEACVALRRKNWETSMERIRQTTVPQLDEMVRELEKTLNADDTVGALNAVFRLERALRVSQRRPSFEIPRVIRSGSSVMDLDILLRRVVQAWQ